MHNNKRVSFSLKLIIITVFLLKVSEEWCQVNHFSESDNINWVDISPDGSMIVSGSQSMNMIIWDASTLSPLLVYNIGVPVKVVKFSKDQSLIGIGYNTSTVHILSGSSPFALQNTLNTNHGYISQLDFSWDSKFLITCGTDTKVKVWNLTDLTTYFTDNLNHNVTACKFARNGQFAASDQDQIRMYKSDGTLNWTDTNGNTIKSFDFDYKSNDFVVVNSDNNVYIYPFWTWTLNNVLNVAESPSKIYNYGQSMYSVAYGKDGLEYSISGSGGLFTIYDASTDNAMYSDVIQSTFSIRASVFSYDSRYLIIGNDQGDMYLYKRMCTNCPAGTYQYIESCRICSLDIKGCELCLNSTYCYICTNGYFVSSSHGCSKCESSLTGCVSCNNSGSCLNCGVHFYMLANNKCSYCYSAMSHCVSCNSSSYCLICDKGYYLMSDHLSCASCEIIPQCSECNTTTYCMSCVRGYYLDTNATCSLCPLNCTTCLSYTNCTQCISGQYPSAGICTTCMANCLYCDSAFTCIECILGQFPSGSSCVSCGQKCLLCYSSGTCQKCNQGYYNTGICNKCINNCQTCISATLCLSCIQGYYYLSAANSCTKCNALITFCKQCSNTTCFACLKTYYYDSVSMSCLQCLSDCLSCISNITCQNCAEGYYISPTYLCLSCGVGCATCLNAITCSGCLPKYYLVVSNLSCGLCGSSCMTCINSSTCSSCIQAYVLNASQQCVICESLISNCSRCYNSTSCMGCHVGYKLSATNSSCLICPFPCASCNTTSCLSCELGYYLTLSAAVYTCTPCAITCSACLTSSSCSACISTHYLQPINSTCIPCESLSAGCSQCNLTVCWSCLSNQGYYYNTSTSLCSSCSDSLINCAQCSSNTTCYHCVYGYVLTNSNSTCALCSDVISFCMQCINATYCQLCFTGHFMSSGACLSCSVACTNCNSSSYCMECADGFLLMPLTHTCLQCNLALIGCARCLTTNSCYNCQEGYTLTTSNNTCQQCQFLILGCSTCNNSTHCSSCNDAYYLSLTTYKCILCTSALVGCSSCLNTTSCLECQVSYALDSVSMTCLPCSDSNCLMCSSNVTCVSCKNGYYINASSICMGCGSAMANCLSCNSSSSCLQCDSGYYRWTSSVCLACNGSGCVVCSENNPSLCVTCDSQYYMEVISATANQCTFCHIAMVGCLNCANNVTCLACQFGYYLSGNVCLLCSAHATVGVGCVACTTLVCFVCDVGYVLINNQTCSSCQVSIPSCKYCLSVSVCLSCMSGFYISANITNSICVECDAWLQGCLFCQNGSSCLTCNITYYLNLSSNTNDHICLSCNASMLGCLQCSSAIQCFNCQGKTYIYQIGTYQLVSNTCVLLKVTSALPYDQLYLTSQYINTTILKHTLWARNTLFQRNYTLNWTKQANITMLDQTSTLIQMVILDVQWGWTGYSLVFTTNNPLNLTSASTAFKSLNLFSSTNKNTTKTGSRMLLDSNLNTQALFNFQMSQNAIQSILPSSTHSGSLSLITSTADPTFFLSVIVTNDSMYNYIGIVVCLYLLLAYVVQIMVTLPQGQYQDKDQGSFLAHVFSVKCAGYVLYPNYMQYVKFCQGFMIVDLPWLNGFFANNLSTLSDYIPESYALYYKTMNLASTYLLCLCVITLMAIILAILYVCNKEKPQKQRLIVGLVRLTYYFFIFGLLSASMQSIIGAYYNPIIAISLNSMFYILGIVVLVIVVGQAFYSIIAHFQNAIEKIRIILKAIILSLLYYQPIYLVPVFVSFEILFLVLLYFINRQNQHKKYVKLWLTSTALPTLSILCLILFPQMILTIILATFFIVAALLIDFYIHMKGALYLRDLRKINNVGERAENMNSEIKKVQENRIAKYEEIDSSNMNLLYVHQEYSEENRDKSFRLDQEVYVIDHQFLEEFCQNQVENRQNQRLITSDPRKAHRSNHKEMIISGKNQSMVSLNDVRQERSELEDIEQVFEQKYEEKYDKNARNDRYKTKKHDRSRPFYE